MKRIFSMALVLGLALSTLVGCSNAATADNKVVIYSSAEEYRNASTCSSV